MTLPHVLALVAVVLSAAALALALYTAIPMTRLCRELKREREYRAKWPAEPRDMPINQFVPWKAPDNRA